MKKICIIGGGTSGMTAAIYAARLGAQVTVLEHKDKLGKKILSTGNGRCNLTNVSMPEGCYRGEDPAFAYRAIQQYGPAQVIQFFEELGVLVKPRDTYIYPRTGQADTVRSALSKELKRLGVSIVTDTHVREIRPQANGFQILADGRRQTMGTDRVILSCGGKAAASLGSDGSGYHIAVSLGHTVSPVVPALVQLRSSDSFFKAVAGVRAHAKVSVLLDEKCIDCDTGELQLTDYGVSGIPVFQISRYAAMGLQQKKAVKIEIDFLPELTRAEALSFLQRRICSYREDTTEELCYGILHRKLIPALLTRAGISRTKQAGRLSEQEIARLLCVCKQFTAAIEGTNPFTQAQVCAGGVRTSELNPFTMESVYVSGCYLTGELLDIDGICGGYNLQWAFTTGYLAGTNAAV